MTSAQLTRRTAEPRLVDEPSVRLGLAGFALFGTAAVVAACHPPTTAAVLGVLTIAVALSATLPRAYACLLGISGWAFAEGFALQDYGVLHVAPADLLLLAGSVLACLAAAVVGER